VSDLPASAAQPAATRPLRVATWNIHDCRRGLTAVARQLASLDADVVGLQEVDRRTRRSGGVDQAAELAARCGFAHHRFFRAIGREGGDYGVALLSRWPLSGERVGMLPNRPGFEQRVVASAVLDFAPARVEIAVTHLTNSRRDGRLRHEQARAIARHLSGGGLPRVVVGDFNEPPGYPAHRALASAFIDVFAAVGQGPGGTFPLVLRWLPALRLDYLFASRELGLAGARVVPTDASDHHPLSAELWLPPPRTAGCPLFEAIG